jgi:hypothetical protein
MRESDEMEGHKIGAELFNLDGEFDAIHVRHDNICQQQFGRDVLSCLQGIKQVDK